MTFEEGAGILAGMSAFVPVLVVEGAANRGYCILQDSCDGQTWRHVAWAVLPESGPLVENFKRGNYTMPGEPARRARRVGYYDTTGKRTSIWES